MILINLILLHLIHRKSFYYYWIMFLFITNSTSPTLYIANNKAPMPSTSLLESHPIPSYPRPRPRPLPRPHGRLTNKEDSPIGKRKRSLSTESLYCGSKRRQVTTVHDSQDDFFLEKWSSSSDLPPAHIAFTSASPPLVLPPPPPPPPPPQSHILNATPASQSSSSSQQSNFSPTFNSSQVSATSATSATSLLTPSAAIHSDVADLFKGFPSERYSFYFIFLYIY